MDFYLFDAEDEAVRYARALGLSSLYVGPRMPPLPRCGHPKWASRSVLGRRGRVARERCRSRTDVDEACPYVTWVHADVVRTAAGKFAVVADADDAARGESVDVDGVSVSLDRARVSRPESEVEQDAPVWRGPRSGG